MNDNGKVRIVKTSEAGGDSASPTLLPWQHPALSTGSSSVEDLPDLTPGPTALQQTVHFFQKHSQAPFSATKEWLVSHWEHGSMLLEPEQMRNRYQKMQAWDGGDWVNFYTETVPGAKREESKDQDRSLKVEHVAFPVAQPYSQKGLPSSPGPPESPPALVSTSSSHIGIATIHFPEPEEPEPFTPLCSDDPNSTGIRSFTISTSSMSDTLSTISQTSSPISQSSIASVSTRNIHSGTLEDQKWPDPPSIPDQTQIEQASTSDSISKAIPLFPEPRPPLDATQQKQHDQAVKSFLKGQENETKQAEKDAEKAKKAAKKAAEADEKARAKAAAKEEKARQKAEKEALRNRLKMTPEQRRAHEPPRRFIILPHESVDRSRWTRVPVAGVPSEVEAHTGIFFSEKNWDYQVFVSTVGDWVIDLCQKRGKEVLGF
ncbi:hypothetical protein FRB96_002903 [Tulasnella sp. 330]|nr:hypothetical protein FRB96_002903 [Tulasnella sp. 330]KAG8884360.1 hypothetical protein FRB98_002439 [Tulasnella sp. 332]